MSINFLKYLLLSISPILYLQVYSQASTAFYQLSENEPSLSGKQPIENVYLQISKDIYETGEDLWFKAYILDAQYLVPSGLSKTLYLQLVNEKNSRIYWQEKYEIQNRFVFGHVYLQDTLPEGNYLLTAFTPYSFFNDSLEFESFRKIEIKKNLKPRNSVKTTFTKPSYSTTDSIGLQIEASSENSTSLYAKITAELKKEDKILQTLQTVTDEKGVANLFFYPEFAAPGLTISIQSKHTNTVERLDLQVPFHQGNSIQFNIFPEGGFLVSGQKSNVAFKTVDTNGDPVETTGTLFENGDTLVQFNSVHAGMGCFEFVPDKNKIYYIRLNKPQSDIHWQLSEIQEKGITFQLVKRDSSSLTFIIRQTPGSEDKVVCLRGQLRGNIYYFQSGVLTDELEITVPLTKFPGQGIAEFALLDENFLPLAERLVYINPDYRLFIDTKLSKEKYCTREKAILKMKVTDKYGQPVVAHLGVSIFDKIYQNTNNTVNIFTYYYLSSQLKGRIYDPQYYFDRKNDNRMEALDLLLLTQGWRVYVWNEQYFEINSNNQQQIVFDGIKGSIKATKKEKQAPKGNQVITIYNPAFNDDKYILLADSTGHFEISPSHLKIGQGGHIYLKPLGAEEYGFVILPDSPFESIQKVVNKKEIVHPISNKIHIKQAETRPFIPGPNVIELSEIKIKGKQNYQFRDKYLGYLDSLTKADLNDHWVCPHGYLENYYVGYSHLCDPPDSLKKKPVEGEQYTLIKYDYIGPNNYFGTKYEWIIRNFIYLYPKYTEQELLKMNNLTRIKGYYIDRKFYQPQYDKTDSLDMIPDYRNTLLWAPNVLTNSDGEATVEFFCSDIYTGFTGIIEGVSGDSRLGHELVEFKVLKTELFEWEKQK